MGVRVDYWVTSDVPIDRWTDGRWIFDSMVRWFDGSMVRWFDGLDGCVESSIDPWFDGSLVRWICVCRSNEPSNQRSIKLSKHPSNQRSIEPANHRTNDLSNFPRIHRTNEPSIHRAKDPSTVGPTIDRNITSNPIINSNRVGVTSVVRSYTEVKPKFCRPWCNFYLVFHV